MTGRRKILFCCALALLIAAGVWLFERSRRLSSVSPVPVAVGLPDASVERTSTAIQPDGAAPTVSTEAARDVAEAEQTATAIDDSTLDPLARLDAGPHTMVLGRVVDEDNKPVAAQVFASTQRTLAGALLDAPVNRERVQTIATDSDGRFAIGKLDPGPLRIAVRAKGFAPLDAREVALPVGERLDLGDLHLTRGVIVTGRVLEHDRRAVKDALLSLVSAPLLGPIQRLGPFTESSLGASDAFGHFELPCVATGKWTLRVHAQNFPDALFEIESRPDQARVDDLEFVLPYSASISGTILDFDKRAMPDLTVTATPVDGLQLFHSSKPDGASEEWLAGTRNEEVDPYGRFLIQGLEAGQSYSLRARRKGNIASGADEEVADRWAPITLAQAGLENVEVCYRPGARLEFEVVDHASGEDLEHLSVRLSGAFPAQPLDEHGNPQRNFPGGLVSMQDLRASGVALNHEPGKEALDEHADITLTIEAPGHDSRILEGLRLEPGRPLLLGAVRLDALAELDVRVLDALTHAPLAGARVQLSADQPQLVGGRTSSLAFTLGNGIARLTSLHTTASTLAVSCAGHAPIALAAPVDVPSGAQAFEVTLPPTPKITVSVRDTRGAAVAAAALLLRHRPANGPLDWSALQRTDAQGVTFFTEIPEGTFSIVVQSRPQFAGLGDESDAELAARQIVVKAGDAVSVDLVVGALSSLSGSFWRGREPLAFATISFSNDWAAFRDLATDMQHFASAARVWTDAHGELSGVEIAPGEYVLLIEQAEFGVRTRRTVIVEKLATNVIIDVDDTHITGRVFDARNQPLAGALVQLFADRPGKRKDIRPKAGDMFVPRSDWRVAISQTQTDASGAYQLDCVPPGVPLEMFFSLGHRAASIARLNVPQGTTLENIDAHLPEGGSLEVILAAPIPPFGVHYGVRIAALRQPEGLALDGATFGANQRAHFDELTPGEWVVMVLSLDSAEQVVDRRQPQTILVKSGKTTEFTAGW